MKFSPNLLLFLTVITFPIVHAWDSDDLELFDLVEEVNQNFYEVMGLEKTASTSDIRRAYRKMSLQYHPDKNKEDNAEEKFRQIVAIAEILKDEEKRQKYNEVLENGLPDWRQPVYYYRRVRKMGMIELFLFLFFLITIGQYLFFWSAYWEKKYELEEIFTSKMKKIEKKNKKLKQSTDQTVSELIAGELDQLQKPRIQDLLPFQMVYFFIFIFKNIHAAPALFQYVGQSLKRSEELEEDESSDEDDDQEERVRKPRKRHTAELPDYTGMMTSSIETSSPEEKNSIENSKLPTEKEPTEWLENDFIMLTKAMKKFPGGCSDRWEKISEMMSKPVSQVTKMAKKVKSSSYSTSVPVSVQGLTGHSELNSSESLAVNQLKNSENDVKRRKHAGAVKSDERTLLISEHIPEGSEPATATTAESSCKSGSSADDAAWSQQQQRTLELALQRFPKGCEDRWDRIAACVPNKSKEDCMIRFKLLAEIVKKKKSLKTS